MFRHAMTGAAAGLLGTAVLNAVTYADVALRGRGTSSMPADAVGAATDRLGVQLGADEETAANRREGLGALSGFATGMGVGAVYGMIAGRRQVPLPVAAVGVGVAAMAATDIPLTVSGLTDPRRWGTAGWLSDVVPHLAYGAAVAAAWRAFRSG